MVDVQGMQRGPLFHIVDALRVDNHQLLVDTLKYDPRYPNNNNNSSNDDEEGNDGHNAGDAAAGNNNDHPYSSTNNNNTTNNSTSSSRMPTRQKLIFGSHNLRRTILHQIIARKSATFNNSGGGGGGGGNAAEDNEKSKKQGKKNKNENKSVMDEEEDLMNELNDELRSITTTSGGGGCNNSGGGGCQVLKSSDVLCPTGDGTLISPHHTTNNNVNDGRMVNTNPFENDDNFNPTTNSNNNEEEEDDENDPNLITTYLLRGNGLDLSSVANAALHHNRIISSMNNLHRHHPYGYQYHHQQGQQQSSQQNQQQPQQQQQPKLFRFVFIPRMSEMERVLLKELGVHDDIIVDESGCTTNVVGTSGTTTTNSTLGGGGGAATTGGGGNKVLNSLESLPIDLIPLDDDVLSLELCGGGSLGWQTKSSGGIGGVGVNSNSESDKGGGGAAASLRHSDVEGCEADVVDIVARSLLKLQLLNQGGNGGSATTTGSRFENDTGVIGRVLGLGPLATAVIDRMMYLRLEEERMDAQAEEEEDDDEYYDEEDEYGGGGSDQQDGSGEYYDDGILKDTSGGVETIAYNNAKEKQQQEQQQPPIQALLVIDRKVDLVTPMLTPLTYEGLIDDVLQIQVGGCVSVKKSIVEPDDGQDDHIQRRRGGGGRDNMNKDAKILLPLNDSDPLYTEVRDKHVEVFGSFLQNQAKALKESHSQFTNRETARDLSEIHQFVKQIPVFTRNLRSLKNHIHIAELVKSAAEATSFRQRWQTERSMLESESQYDTLEDLIASGEPPYRWLRLFCLQSLTSNGIKATRYDALRKEVVQTYGFEYMIVLNDLEKAGFLRKRETFFMDSMATSYSTLRKSLNLINAEVDPSNPDDPAYVSSGYAPITVRWVQAAMRGYLGLDEALKELPVAAGSSSSRRWIDIEQNSPPESLVEALKRNRGPSLGVLAKKMSESSSHDGRGNQQASGKKPLLLVYYVGGITYMEIAALRFLSRRPSFPYTIVCCTTEIVNGETLLRSLSC